MKAALTASEAQNLFDFLIWEFCITIDVLSIRIEWLSTSKGSVGQKITLPFSFFKRKRSTITRLGVVDEIGLWRLIYGLSYS